MNGDSFVPGREPADPGQSGDHGSLERFFRNADEAQEALEKYGEWRLAREISDAKARWEATRAARQGERRSEGVHGEDQAQTQVVRQLDIEEAAR